MGRGGVKMDALKFIEERNRMCDYYGKKDGTGGCADCPERDSTCNVVRFVTPEYIADVEKWSQEHPRKTRQSEFLEMFPTAKMDNDGSVDVCPAEVDAKQRDPDGQGCGDLCKDCAVCRRQFWMQEVE